MPSSTARLTTGHSVWSSTSGHTDSASKNIQSTTPASWSVSCTERGINLQLKDKGKSNFVETTACSDDILKAFWGTCSKMFCTWW